MAVFLVRSRLGLLTRKCDRSYHLVYHLNFHSEVSFRATMAFLRYVTSDRLASVCFCGSFDSLRTSIASLFPDVRRTIWLSVVVLCYFGHETESGRSLRSFRIFEVHFQI